MLGSDRFPYASLLVLALGFCRTFDALVTLKRHQLPMKSFLIILLIVLAPCVIAMAAVRLFLYFTVVVPRLSDKGPRFWLNALFGDTQSRHTKAYISALAPEQRTKWPNWYLSYGGYLIALMAAVWCVILLLAR